MVKVPQEILEAFTNYTPGLPKHSAGKMTVEPMTGGLINRTFKVTCQLRSPFLLQQINTKVFTNPEEVQSNYILLSQYAEFEFTGQRMPWPIYLNEKETLFVDAENNYWRAFEFIGNAISVNNATKAAQAKAAAKTFAKFTSAFDEFNVDLLKETIPGFHNLSLRYKQFEDALQTELYERMAKALPMIEQLKQRERYKHFYEIITESDEFPKRVMHHDAKIANVLFSRLTGKVICPVDFDTVMPGYFFSDIGDMIRSMTCRPDENSLDYAGISIRKSFYNAIVEGYLAVLGKQLTDSEKKYIHYSGLLIIYMQSLRFLTDYLNGDVYYKIDYPEQNFDRARNQLTLLQSLEEFLIVNYNFKM